jgi:hypothetical protein
LKEDLKKLEMVQKELFVLGYAITFFDKGRRPFLHVRW